MSDDERLAALKARIGVLERDAALLAAESSTDDSRCRADLLRASLVGTRASLDLASDDAALASAEDVVDAVSRNLTGLMPRPAAARPAAVREP